jgi:predicted nucleotidyltransferase
VFVGTILAPNEVRVLRALLRVETPLTGRAVARITGLTQSTAQRTLTRLREGGLVLAESAPPSLLYRANPDHLAMPAMISLLGLDDELRARVADGVAAWPLQPASLVVYGSVARKETTSASDLDVLVVRPDTTEPDDATWQGQVADLADRLRRWTGRRTSLIDMSQHELVQGLADREPFLVAADRDGWLIAGRPLGELLGRKS